MSEQATAREPDIHRVLRVLRRRKLVIVALALIVPAAALVYSLNQRKEYTAKATLLFQDPQLTQQITGSLTLVPAEDPSRVTATNIKLVELGAVANATAHQLHHAIGSVSVSGDASTDVVNVSATEASPAFAATVANAYAAQYVTFRRQQDADTVHAVRTLITREYAALSRPQQRSAQGKSLLKTADRLRVLASLQTGNAQLVQSASAPSAPSSPKTVRNVILGFAVGLLLGLALAFLPELIDRRVREPSELEEIYERPVLASVPELRELRTDGSGASGSLPGHAVEAFQMLRANLRYFNVDRELKVVLVTSAVPGEGKTTVAWSLAAAAARGRTRTLLIEADLRRPAVQTRHRITPGGGLSTLLSSQESLTQEVEHVPLRSYISKGDNERVATLDVLPAGPKPPNPTDLLESQRMADLLVEAKASYDLVVVDTPPASMVSDAVPLMRLVDGILVVSRLRKVTREASMHLHKQLERLDAPIIGIVVNAMHKEEGSGYGYGYGYYTKDGRAYLSPAALEAEPTVVVPEPNGNGSGHTEAADEAPMTPEQTGK